MKCFGRSRSVALAALLLAGCAPNVAVERPAVVPARPAFSTLGLESVLGRSARALEARFGRPDLEVREGSARKLQFSGPACVLDAYLYPPARGGEAVVTHVDARRPDGSDLDRASCVAALGQR
ncbi:MAG TPA: hypothetical protein VGW34_15710 [Allosphingosinicella sp.]|nr:hypothetical protein [Allosphingosinicella sp.]